MKVRQIVNSKQQKSCPIIWRSFKTVHPTVLEHIPHRLRCLPPLFLGLVFSLLICVIILIFTTMQINKWRLFGIHYAVVLMALLLWTFTVTHRYGYNGSWIHWVSIIWPSVVSTLFLEKDAPVLNALLLTLFSTSFYLFIFQDLIQKKYKRFIGKFFLFIVIL